MENELKKYNPRKILGFWEAQALATLTSKNYPTSFKAISGLMNDDNTDMEIKRASNILFWGRVWRQAKTKEDRNCRKTCKSLAGHLKYQQLNAKCLEQAPEAITIVKVAAAVATVATAVIAVAIFF